VRRWWGARATGAVQARWLSWPAAVGTGLIAGALLVSLAYLAGSHVGRSIDEHALNVLNQQGGNSTLLSFGDRVNNGAKEIIAVWCVVVVIIALVWARDLLSATGGLATVTGSLLVSEAVKNHVAVRHPKLGASLPRSLEHTWPSTHAAALAALAMATIVIHPTRRCAWIAGALLVIFSSCLCLTAAHFPSDVLGGWLVAVGVLAIVSLPIGLVKAAARRVKAFHRRSGRA
jgi:membrane-associated phospholipid phosphatase